ncbi:uncharacterized protein METZ01_LOCUS319954, partial [marine metagenome]
PVPRRHRLRCRCGRTGRAQGWSAQALRRAPAVRGCRGRHLGPPLRPSQPRLPGFDEVCPRSAGRRHGRCRPPRRGGSRRGADGRVPQHRSLHVPRHAWPLAGTRDPARHATRHGDPHIACTGQAVAGTGRGSGDGWQRRRQHDRRRAHRRCRGAAGPPPAGAVAGRRRPPRRCRGTQVSPRARRPGPCRSPRVVCVLV